MVNHLYSPGFLLILDAYISGMMDISLQTASFLRQRVFGWAYCFASEAAGSFSIPQNCITTPMAAAKRRICAILEIDERHLFVLPTDVAEGHFSMVQR